MKIKIAIGCLLFSVLAGRGADFDLGAHGTLSVIVPGDWGVSSHAAKRPDGTLIGYAFAFKPHGEANASCQLTLAFTTNGIPNKEAIRKLVLRSCEMFVEQSVEKKENLKEFSLEKGYGAYCLFTDASLVGKNPTPGDYKIMGSGVVQPGDNMLGVVSILCDEAEGNEFKAMLGIINSLKVKPKEPG
jgi:hypothetical protein